VAQQRDDDGGTGDYQDCPEQNCQLELETGQEVSERGGQEPGNRYADQHQAPEHAADVSQLRDVEREAALEQDYGDGERHDWQQYVAQQRVGVEEARHRSGYEPDEEQQQDGWQAQSPGQPLGADAQYEDAREPDE
jgi:hypothetical protein